MTFKDFELHITNIYTPDFQRQITIEESPIGKSYFEEEPKSFLL